ncbi:hypothetical protein D3C75_544900 [compost metagenome]
MIGVELDPSDDFFTIFTVGYADHLHVGHGWVGEEELLQLPRINVLAAAND